MLTFEHYNKQWVRLFNAIVISHFFEHVAQMLQLYVLHWQRKDSLGFLGLVYPEMVRSEWLHYSHALFMLIGLAMLCKVNRWLFLAFTLAFLHHIEHFCLLYQAITKLYWFNTVKPMTYVEHWLPRIELHFSYNLIVLVPMVIGLMQWSKRK